MVKLKDVLGLQKPNPDFTDLVTLYVCHENLFCILFFGIILQIILKCCNYLLRNKHDCLMKTLMCPTQTFQIFVYVAEADHDGSGSGWDTDNYMESESTEQQKNS